MVAANGLGSGPILDRILLGAVERHGSLAVSASHFGPSSTVSLADPPGRGTGERLVADSASLRRCLKSLQRSLHQFLPDQAGWVLLQLHSPSSRCLASASSVPPLSLLVPASLSSVGTCAWVHECQIRIARFVSGRCSKIGSLEV